MDKDLTTRETVRIKPIIDQVRNTGRFLLTLLLTGAVTGSASMFAQETMKVVELDEKAIEYIVPKAQQASQEIRTKYEQVIKYLDSANKDIRLYITFEEIVATGVATAWGISNLYVFRDKLMAAIQETYLDEVKFWQPTNEMFDNIYGNYLDEEKQNVSTKDPVVPKDGQTFFGKVNQVIQKQEIQGNAVSNFVETVQGDFISYGGDDRSDRRKVGK